MDQDILDYPGLYVFDSGAYDPRPTKGQFNYD